MKHLLSVLWHKSLVKDLETNVWGQVNYFDWRPGLVMSLHEACTELDTVAVHQDPRVMNEFVW